MSEAGDKHTVDDDDTEDEELPPMTKLDCFFVVIITTVVLIPGSNLAIAIVLGAILCNVERLILKRKPWEDSEYFEREHEHGIVGGESLEDDDAKERGKKGVKA